MRATWWRCPRLHRSVSYGFLTSPIGTVFSFPSVLSLTTTFPAFSSTLTTVASASDPFIVTFTASPALSCAAADGLGSGVGEAGAGVETAWFIGLVLLFAFEFSGPLDSQAVRAIDRSVTARIFFVMVILHSDGCLYVGKTTSLLER